MTRSHSLYVVWHVVVCTTCYYFLVASAEWWQTTHSRSLNVACRGLANFINKACVACVKCFLITNNAMNTLLARLFLEGCYKEREDSRDNCDDLLVVIRFFPESLSFPQFPPFIDNGRASLVIAFLLLSPSFSHNFHNSVLTNFLYQQRCMSKQL